MLELKAAENEAKAAEEGNKSYSAVWVPLVTGIIGAIVVFLSASVVSQADRLLLMAALARVTFSRMSVALAVQMKGLGLSLCRSM